jgi:hypothetical protein
LHVAQTVARWEGLRDFIIPLRVDDALAYSDINIQLARINAIDFSAGWAIGLHTLLKKLRQDGVQKGAQLPAAGMIQLNGRSVVPLSSTGTFGGF